MAGSAGFFGQRSPQAVLKHGLLTRYAYYFAGRAGSAAHGRVAYIDGYAGEGRYEDGNPGSPLLLASEAQRAALINRQVKLAFVERDPERRERLRRTLSDEQVAFDELVDADLETSIDALLDRYTDHAVLLFVDPFGLGLSRNALERVLNRRSPRQPIDVLYHFSLSSLARMGRAALLPGPLAEKNATLIDAALGRVDWRTAFSETDNATGAAISSARVFGGAVQGSTGLRCSSVPVRQRPGHLPKYLLMLFSADNKAHWNFADLASLAYVEWLHFCDRSDYDGNLARQDAQGLMELFPPVQPSTDEIDERLGDEAQRYFAEHLPAVLRSHDGIRPIDHIEQIYGAMLGRAREKHLREALKRLHHQGVVDDDGTREFWYRPIRWIGD